MKKAFTMIELVFVIAVVGILAATILPKTKKNSVKEAAIQLISHIKYTQHLAIVDDKFDSMEPNWYKTRWQISFGSSAAADNKPAYTIYADTSGANTGDANEAEIARNPLNSDQVMTGGYSGANALDVNHADFIGMETLNLGITYKVTSVTMSSSCKVNGSSRISFDHLGRPIKGKLGAASGGGNQEAYELDNLIQSNCDITLTDGAITSIIRVAPETGYTCMLNTAGTACI